MRGEILVATDGHLQVHADGGLPGQSRGRQDDHQGCFSHLPYHVREEWKRKKSISKDTRSIHP